jgi:SAM-dependent methyltransferase
VQQAELELVPCPLCSQGRFEVLCGTDRYDHGITTTGCLHCGLVMTNPQPTSAALDDFYANHYRHYYQKVDKPSLEYIRQYRKDERAAATAHYIADQGLLPADAAVLDIGGSEGCILKALRDLQPGISSVAVEPNPDFGAFAREHAGCEVFADLSQLPPGRAFDLIVINHVYEHIKQPVHYLQSLRERLSPRGRIYIDVPDLAAYKGLESLHVAHLYHFCEATLRRAAETAGFKVFAIERHAPIKHPLSVRVVIGLSSEPSSTAATCDWTEDWDRLRQINRRAARYHRRRWSRLKRLRYRLAALVAGRRILETTPPR